MNQGLATLAFFGVNVNLVLFLTRVLQQSNGDAANNVSKWTGTVYMFSLIGAFLSDSYWGRYKTCAIFQAIFVLVSTTTPSSSICTSRCAIEYLGLPQTAWRTGFYFCSNPDCWRSNQLMVTHTVDVSIGLYIYSGGDRSIDPKTDRCRRDAHQRLHG